MTAVLAMETQQAATRRRAAVLARAPVALVFLRGGRTKVRAAHPAVPRDVETALLALLDELRTEVFLPLRRARRVPEAEAALAQVRAPFRALWGAVIATLIAGLELRSAADAVETVLERSALPPNIWTGRAATGRLGAASLPFWAAAYDARAQTARALAHWPDGRDLPAFDQDEEHDLIESALAADLAIMFAVDVLALSRAVRVPVDVSKLLARAAHDNARKVFVAITTPLYRDAQTSRG